MDLEMDGDCDYCWGLEPPPLFRLPPPPRPPIMMDDEGCHQPQPGLALASEYYKSAEDPADTCQAFLMSGGEFQQSDAFPSIPVIIVSAALLTTVILIAGLLLWRHRRRQYLSGTGKSSSLPLPPSTPGVNGIHDFYDELISHPPPHFRHPTTPTLSKSYLPPMEMSDILKMPCHSPALPLLSHQQSPQFAPSPHSSSTSSSQHSRGTTGAKGHKRRSWQQTAPRRDRDRDHDRERERERHVAYQPVHLNHAREEVAINSSGWLSDPLYEELPSGSEEDESKKSVRLPLPKASQRNYQLPTPLSSSTVASARSKSPLQHHYLTPRLDSEGGSERTNSQSQSAGESESLTSSSDAERPHHHPHHHRVSKKHQRQPRHHSNTRYNKQHKHPDTATAAADPNRHTNPLQAVLTSMPNVNEFIGPSSRGELMTSEPLKQGTHAIWKEYADDSHYANLDVYQPRFQVYHAPNTLSSPPVPPPNFSTSRTQPKQAQSGHRSLPYREHGRRSGTTRGNPSHSANRRALQQQRDLEQNQGFHETLLGDLKHLSPQNMSTLPFGLYRGKCPPEPPPREMLQGDPRYVTTTALPGKLGKPHQNKDRELPLLPEQEKKYFTLEPGERS